MPNDQVEAGDAALLRASVSRFRRQIERRWREMGYWAGKDFRELSCSDYIGLGQLLGIWCAMESDRRTLDCHMARSDMIDMRRQLGWRASVAKR